MLSEKLTDSDWKNFILAWKADFRRVGREKSAIMRSFEKYYVFQNKFKILADQCARLHEAIIDEPVLKFQLPASAEAALRETEANLKALGARADRLFSNCLKLRLMMPIMAEAYINMVIITFCKDEIRNDHVQYEAFVRAKIPERIDLLARHCGFVQKIDVKSQIYGDFLRVMNLRNFSLHGNVDPVREQIETVFFEGRRPLFSESGDHHLRFFEHLEQTYKPQEVIRDYEAVHSFLAEIASCLSERHQRFSSKSLAIHSPDTKFIGNVLPVFYPIKSLACFCPASDMTMNSRSDWEA